MRSHTRGYIALMSVLILGSALLATTASLSLSTWSGRMATLAYTWKHESESLARACVEVARLRLAEDPLYEISDEETIYLGTNTCTLLSVTRNGSESTISTTASVKNRITTYEVTLNNETGLLLSWKD